MDRYNSFSPIGMKNRLRKYDEALIVVGVELEKHYDKTTKETKARVMTVNGFIEWLQ